MDNSGDDFSGNGFHGEVIGSTFTQDRFGSELSSAYFDWSAVEGYGNPWHRIEINPGFDGSLNGAFTVAAWIKPEHYYWPQNSAHSAMIFGYASRCPNTAGLRFSIEGEGALRLRWGNNAISDEGAVVLNEWQHVVGTIAQDSMRVYINGVQVGSAPAVEGPTSGCFNIGELHQTNGHWYYFDGAIDDLGVWDHALSESEISALYNSEAIILSCTDPAACNYEEGAEEDDGSCIYPEAEYDCEGICLEDDDLDGICNALEVLGCTDPAACNFNALATEEDGTCQTAPTLGENGVLVHCSDGGSIDAGPGFDSYLWSTGETSQVIDVSEAGTYSVVVQGEASAGNASAIQLSTDNEALSADLSTTQALEEATWMGWFYFDDLQEPHGLIVENNGYNTNGYYINVWHHPTDVGDDDLVSALWFSSPAGNSGGKVQSYTSPAVIQSETWHHLAFVLEEGQMDFYVDGNALEVEMSLENNASESGYTGHVVTPADAPLYVGTGTNLSGGLNQPMRGKIDEFSFWDRALTPSEIAGFMGCRPSVQESGLQALWTFEGGTDDIALDFSQNGNDASIAAVSVVDEAPSLTCQECLSESSVQVVQIDCDGFCGEGTHWDAEVQECIISVPSDTDFDGCVSMTDLLDLLTVFGTCPETESESEPLEWACGDPLGYQGYNYETVQIGEQCWFAENLRAEEYSNGDPIPMVFENSDWQASTEGARCWINNDSTYFGFPGFLYHGYTVIDNRGVCPAMWHVADDAEWMELEIAHGLSASEAEGTGIRGGDIQLSQKMRVASWGGTNELGFGARRGGYRSWETGSFSGGIDSGAFWSNGESLGGPGYREFHGPWDGVARGGIGISEGLSIRCIQDSE